MTKAKSRDKTINASEVPENEDENENQPENENEGEQWQSKLDALQAQIDAIPKPKDAEAKAELTVIKAELKQLRGIVEAGAPPAQLTETIKGLQTEIQSLKADLETVRKSPPVPSSVKAGDPQEAETKPGDQKQVPAPKPEADAPKQEAQKPRLRIF